MQGIFRRIWAPVRAGGTSGSLKNPEKDLVIERAQKFSKKQRWKLFRKETPMHNRSGATLNLGYNFTHWVFSIGIQLWYRDDGRKTADEVADEFLELLERNADWTSESSTPLAQSKRHRFEFLSSLTMRGF